MLWRSSTISFIFTHKMKPGGDIVKCFADPDLQIVKFDGDGPSKQAMPSSCFCLKITISGIESPA